MQLREKLAADLAEGFEWSAADEALLDQAEGLLATIAQLEEVIVQEGVVVTGSTGQSRINGAVAEVRLARATVARIVSLVSVSMEKAVAAAGPVKSGTRYSARDVRRR